MALWALPEAVLHHLSEFRSIHLGVWGASQSAWRRALRRQRASPACPALPCCRPRRAHSARLGPWVHLVPGAGARGSGRRPVSAPVSVPVSRRQRARQGLAQDKRAQPACRGPGHVAGLSSPAGAGPWLLLSAALGAPMTYRGAAPSASSYMETAARQAAQRLSL